LDYYLKLIGEPIKWTMESPELEAFLKQQKCKILSLDETDQFRDMFLKGNDPVTLHRGEYLAAAEFERR
jgi:hypothetical protein